MWVVIVDGESYVIDAKAEIREASDVEDKDKKGEGKK